jgi:hypothetical protein
MSESPVPTPAEAPAAVLRRAAEKMRTLAQRATDGPWTASPVYSPDASATSGVYSYAHPTGTVLSEVVASGRIKQGYGGIRHPGNAVYIAAMHPGVALLIAESWAAHATEMEEYGATESRSGVEAQTVWGKPDPVWSTALAAARAFLAEAVRTDG